MHTHKSTNNNNNNTGFILYALARNSEKKTVIALKRWPLFVHDVITVFTGPLAFALTCSAIEYGADCEAAVIADDDGAAAGR